MNLFRRARIVVLTVLIGIAMLAVQPLAVTDIAFAGPIKKAVGAYAAVKTVKRAMAAKKYLEELKRVSGRMPDKAQRKLVYDCIRAVAKCYKNHKSHGKEWEEVRGDVKREWERQTGQKWPTYDKPLMSKSGRPYKDASDDWEAHHIIPKNNGGPHEWWNMHPVPRPDHQTIIHGAGSALRQIMGGIK